MFQKEAHHIKEVLNINMSQYSVVLGFTGKPIRWVTEYFGIPWTEWSCLQSLWKMSSCEIIPVVINHHLECVCQCVLGRRGILHSLRAKKTDWLFPHQGSDDLAAAGSFDSSKTYPQGCRSGGEIWMIQGPPRAGWGPLEDAKDFFALCRAQNFN